MMHPYFLEIKIFFGQTAVAGIYRNNKWTPMYNDLGVKTIKEDVSVFFYSFYN